MPYTLQVQNCITEYTNSLQSTLIVHTKKNFIFFKFYI